MFIMTRVFLYRFVYDSDFMDMLGHVIIDLVGQIDPLVRCCRWSVAFIGSTDTFEEIQLIALK